LNLNLEDIFVTGINFKKAGVDVRGIFSLDANQKHQCCELAKEHGFADFIVLSTCNRTEVYGIGSVVVAEDILSRVCGQSAAVYEQYKFVKRGDEALTHIFNVAAGIDSQILGDYEILGQFKTACKLSKTESLLGPMFERLANVCIQASKDIKTQTSLSQGTVSASYAAIEVIKERFKGEALNILLIGTGKFGHNIAKNISHYLPGVKLTISNRTISKAIEIADQFGFDLLPFEEIKANAAKFDIIIQCANSEGYLLYRENFNQSKTKLILDLAMPQSVDPSVKTVAGIELMEVDSISSILEKTIDHRKSFLPAAFEIISHYMNAFKEWHKLYSQRDLILVLKERLNALVHQCPHLMKFETEVREKMMNVAINTFVKNMKEGVVIPLDDAINSFIALNHVTEKSY
jgi:glutamyl-tRNA reductase